MKNYFTLILCLWALFLNSCKKTESEPLPPTTEQITGNNGQTILGGSGLPNATYGKNGDFYLDKATANLYGPKIDNAWPQPFNLANNTGTTGTPGTKILSGTIAPALTIGALGDFYFDTAALNFYGPKTSESWGLPISLKVQTDGAKVLIYKNQVFNSVVRDTANDSRLKLQITDYKKKFEELKVMWEGNVIFYKPNKYLKLPVNATLNQQKSFLDSIKGVTFLVPNAEQFFLTEATIIRLEKYSLIGNYILNSEIAIEAKYQDYYENGMVMVYLKNSINAPSIWQESLRLIETKNSLTGSTATYASCYVEKILKDKIYFKGSSYQVEEALVKAVKFDVKIVFIPASEVITMGAAKIDTHNLKAITRYLGVVLNK